MAFHPATHQQYLIVCIVFRFKGLMDKLIILYFVLSYYYVDIISGEIRSRLGGGRSSDIFCTFRSQM